MRRLLLLVAADTSAEQVAFGTWLASPQNKEVVGYWHWIENGWLIADQRDRSFEFWRDIAITYFGQTGKRWFLQDVPAGNMTAWYGVLPNEALDWLRVYWSSLPDHERLAAQARLLAALGKQPA